MPYVLVHPLKGVYVGNSLWSTKSTNITASSAITFPTTKDATEFVAAHPHCTGSRPRYVRSGHWRDLVRHKLPVGLMPLNEARPC